jgi:methyltransferase (TIGR00027 family)
MTTQGIEAVFLQTHNWGKAARFFQDLGFTLDFETDHNSGQLRNGDGPYVFVAEVPPGQPAGAQVVLKVADEAALRPGAGIEVVSGWEDTHYGTREMTVRDPDGRTWILQAPPRPAPEPDSTAVRVALWRARHLEVDAAPHVLSDEIGLKIAAPAPGWRDRPDMSPQLTAGFRASIVARARFIEDLVDSEAARGVSQYVILGAGLDTFAQRRPDLGGRLQVFEVDQPGTQEWKRQRLVSLGYGIPDWLHLVPSSFGEGEWQKAIVAAGFDVTAPAVVASAGVSMYLTKDANAAVLRQLASLLAPGSTVAMTFLLPLDLLDDADRHGAVISQRGAAASGTPFLSFFTPEEIMSLAREAGFKDVRHVSSADHNTSYFTGRPDGLRSSAGEDLLVATT